MILEPEKFPIDKQLEVITNSLNEYSSLLLKAETGAGKTTRLPPYLVSKTDSKVLVLEPRRLAAKLSAKRCADILKTKLGTKVGHHIRFDKQTSDETSLLFITEGLFLSYLREDPTLSKYDVIILDEFHERSIHTDTALCLIRRLQATTRPDLKLIVMSATLDTTELERYLSGALVFDIPGRVFPLQIEYPHLDTKDAITNMLNDLRCPQNILVFLPGVRAIRLLQDQLKNSKLDGVEIVPLYSSLPLAEQNKAFKGKNRKIILSTNIAETSLTIPNVTGVIDTGTERRASFAPWSGMPLLQLEKISKASATQRAGRAGRVQEGLVYRTYDVNDLTQRMNFTPPEVKRVELSHYILDLIELGYNPEELNWFEDLEKKNLESAMTLLHTLEALKENKITELGKYIARLPLHPRLGAMIYNSLNSLSLNDVLLSVCIINEGMVLSKQGKFTNEDEDEFCDLTLQSNLVKFKYWNDRDLSDYNSHMLDLRAYKRVIELYQALAKRLKIKKTPSKEKTLPEDLTNALLSGYSDRVAAKRKSNRKGKNIEAYNFCMGRGGKLASNSALISTHPDFIIVLDALENPKANAAVGTNITSATRVTIEDLESMNSKFLSTKKESLFNEKKGKLTISTISKYGSITLSTTTDLPVIPKGEVLSELIQSNWPWPFDDDLALQRYNKRVSLLNSQNIEHNCPEFTGEMFELFIEANIEEETSYQDILTKGLTNLIHEQLTPQDRYVLDTEAPLEITLNNTKKFKIEYFEEEPFVKARIQDLFGTNVHPTIVMNKIPLVLKLLSPANKVIQNAYDINQLWGESWLLLKADLGPRYPRHYWPDNPKESRPIRRKKDV